MPRVSILTPSYNQARFLALNLESVRTQGDVEHIVVDGASTDGSRELLQQSGVKWISEPDKGQADALTKALAMASGEILGWLNSDDVYRPGAVARALGFFDADPSLDMVWGHCDKIDAHGNVFGRVDAYDVDLEALLAHATIPQPSAFVKRAAVERAGGIDAQFRYALDYDLWLRLALRGAKWRAVDETWAQFRIHDASKSGAEAQKFLPEVERAMEQALASPLLPPSLAARKDELRSRHFASVGKASLANLDMSMARKELWRAFRLRPASVEVATLGKSLLPRALLRGARRVRATLRGRSPR